jgi:hypothetical protein
VRAALGIPPGGVLAPRRFELAVRQVFDAPDLQLERVPW